MAKNSLIRSFERSLYSQQGSVVEVFVWYFVGLAFLVGFYLVFWLYFDEKPLNVFAGIFGFLTFVMLIALIRALLKNPPAKKKKK